jgi:hypothetical protein
MRKVLVRKKDQSEYIVEKKTVLSLVGPKSFIMNYRWNRADEDFPLEPWMRTVDKFYDHAKCLVDYPYTKTEILLCERKRKVIEARGFKYVIALPEMTQTEIWDKINE